MPFGDDTMIERCEDAIFLLDVTYGPRPFTPSGDLEHEIVMAILSQSTNDRNSSAAYAALKAAYPTWDDVLEAPIDELTQTIKIGGLARQKAPRIQQLLQAVRNEQITPDFLREMGDRKAMEFLTSLEGIGPKSAACILLFGLGMPVMPIDTHIARVATRCGFVPDRTSTDSKQWILRNLVSMDDAPTIYAAHVEMIEHGRTVCHPRDPDCGHCVLREMCNTGRGLDPRPIWGPGR